MGPKTIQFLSGLAIYLTKFNEAYKLPTNATEETIKVKMYGKNMNIP